MLNDAVNLAFFDPGSHVALFFHEISKIFPSKIRSVFISSKPKIISRLRNVGAEVLDLKKLSLAEYVPSEEELENSKGPYILPEYRNPPKVNERALNLFRKLDRCLSEREIDFVVVWGEAGMEVNIAANVMKKNGGRVIYCENGYFPETMQIDHQGINYSSSITEKIRREFKNVVYEERYYADFENAIECYKKGRLKESVVQPYRVNPSIIARLENVILSTAKIKNKLVSMKSAPNKEINWSDGKNIDNYVFLALQVKNDNERLPHSPLIGNDMHKMIYLCHEATKKINRNLSLVVKLHPRDGKTDYSQIAKSLPDIFFMRKTPVRNLLEKASAVIAINSTVGFEALFYYKPVVMLGKNFYGVPEIVTQVDNIESLETALNEAMTRSIDKNTIEKLLYFVYRHYSVKGCYNNFSPDSIRAVKEKFVGIIEKFVE